MRKILAFLTITLSAFAYTDNIDTNLLASRIQNGSIKCTADLRCSSPVIAKFYKNRGFTPAWVKGGQLTANGTAMVDALAKANFDGLDPRTYHINQIKSMLAILKKNNADSELLTNLDLTITDGTLLYVNNLVNGLQNGKRLYPSWPIAIKNTDLVASVNQLTQADDVNKALITLAPKYRGYAKLREKLADYYAIANQGGWATIPDGEALRLGIKSSRVALLQKRLYVSGELAEIDTNGEFDEDLQKAVIQYQQNNGLNDDGIVSSQTLKSLNVPVEKRIRQIELNMDRMRFLPDSYPSRYVMVNIPDYSLETFENGRITLFSDVVVGKPNKKTCVLNSQIAKMEINPYWNIPVSIVKEILPEIRKDPNYLADNGIKVFQVDSDNQYIAVDPKSIDWKSDDPAIYNLRFREDPGEDNALGRFKFIFANNCGIYLHDSIAQSAFDETNRGLSHGCIRVAEVDDFANYLIKPNGWDKKRLSAEVDSNRHQFVKLSSPTALYVIYLTAWYDADTDFVQFRDDIYRYDKLSAYPLYLPNT